MLRDKKRYKSGSWCIFILLTMCLMGCATQERTEGGQIGVEETIATDYTTIIMTYQTIDTSKIDDLEAVRAAINAITIPEIGVEVEIGRAHV